MPWTLDVSRWRHHAVLQQLARWISKFSNFQISIFYWICNEIGHTIGREHRFDLSHCAAKWWEKTDDGTSNSIKFAGCAFGNQDLGRRWWTFSPKATLTQCGAQFVGHSVIWIPDSGSSRLKLRQEVRNISNFAMLRLPSSSSHVL